MTTRTWKAGHCRFEPRVALSPGGDGLDAIRAHRLCLPFITLAAGLGRPAFEHGFDEGEASRSILEELSYIEVETRQPPGRQESGYRGDKIGQDFRGPDTKTDRLPVEPPVRCPV